MNMLEWFVKSKDILECLFYFFSIAGFSIWGAIWVKGTVLFKTFILRFKRFKFLLSDEFQLSVRVANYLHNLDDCHIWINKDVIGDDDKDYMISPILLTVICNVIENEIEDYCHCGNKVYTPMKYYNYLYYIRTGKIKPNTLDDRRINALKNALNLCKTNLSYSDISIKLDNAGLPWKTNNINIKQKWNI